MASKACTKEMKEGGADREKSKWCIGDLCSDPPLMKLRAVGMSVLRRYDFLLREVFV